MKKNTVSSLLCLLLTLLLLMAAGCAPQAAPSESSPASVAPSSAPEQQPAGTIEITFWSAPKQVQCDLWTKHAEAFNALGVTYNNKTIRVTVEMIPETDSSEAAIQNALATDSAPAVSENINNSFMAVLASSDAVYPLTGQDWFEEILERKLISDEIMDTWEYNGEQYVLPEYINSLCLIWNVKALNALGFSAPPATYDEYVAVIQAFKENRDAMKEMGCEFTFTRPSFLTPAKSYHRNYDFLMIYQSFGGGELFLDNKMNIDPAIAARVFDFYGMLGNSLCVETLSDIWTGENPLVLFDIGCPWNIASYDAAGKVYGEDYVFAQNVVAQPGDQAYCYADTKGIVFYKDANITDEMHGAAVEFIKWVYNEENCAQSDLAFFEASAQMPVRGDMLTNEVFGDIMGQEVWQFLAEQIPYSLQGPTHLENVTLYESLCEDGLMPYFTQTIQRDMLDTLDPAPYVEAMLQGMIADGGLDG